MHKTGKEIVCVTCGSVKYKAAWELRKSKSDKHFCSRACSNKDPEKMSAEVKQHLRELAANRVASEETRAKLRAVHLGKPRPAIQGPKHPRWKGGISGYPTGFSASIKRKIRLRDGYRCAVCGMDEQTHRQRYGKKLSIHHVDHNRHNNVPSNLLTLCCYCNSKEVTEPETYIPVIKRIVESMARPS